jgi:hypothetical protein
MGDPNPALSTKRQLRYGRRGSIAVEIAGPKRGLWVDHSNGEGGDILDLIRRETGADFSRAVKIATELIGGGTVERMRTAAPVETEDEQEKRDRDRRFIAQTLAGSVPIEGTPATAYLRWRGCAMPVCPDVLAFHPKVRHPSGIDTPVMVARLTDARDAGRLTGLHMIAMTPTGEGRSDLAPRKWTRGTKQGSVVRLWPDEDVDIGLGIAEGIETALSVAADGWCPVWSTLDAGNMAALPVLNPLTLTVFADADEAGMKAADTLVTRWTEAGLGARVVRPAEDGADWAGVPYAA